MAGLVPTRLAPPLFCPFSLDTQPMKTLTLDFEYDCDFELFGLVSSTREHRLAWLLNTDLRLRLIKQQDIIYDLLSRGRLVISNYLHTTHTCTLRLLRNRSVAPSTLKKPYLAPDVRQYDYLLQISNGTGTLAPEQVLARLTALDDVQHVCQLDPNQLEFKENLFF